MNPELQFAPPEAITELHLAIREFARRYSYSGTQYEEVMTNVIRRHENFPTISPCLKKNKKVRTHLMCINIYITI